ncbi:hypothetical protein U1Q18_028962 [Sarracenia purpurea var. burkii]
MDRRYERDRSKQAGVLRKEEAVRAGGFLVGFGGDAGKDANPSASKEFEQYMGLIRAQGRSLSSTWGFGGEAAEGCESVRKEGV